MDTSPRLGMPLLSAAQLQKELWVNESLFRVDQLLCGRIGAVEHDEPPAAPAESTWFRVGQAPTGAWQGKAGHIAAWSPAGWRFLEPFEGLELADADDSVAWRFDGASWRKGQVKALAVVIDGVQVLGSRQPAVADPAGGATIDLEARTAIRDLLAVVRAHGLIG